VYVCVYSYVCACVCVGMCAYVCVCVCMYRNLQYASTLNVSKNGTVPLTGGANGITNEYSCHCQPNAVSNRFSKRTLPSISTVRTMTVLGKLLAMNAGTVIG